MQLCRLQSKHDKRQPPWQRPCTACVYIFTTGLNSQGCSEYGNSTSNHHRWDQLRHMSNIMINQKYLPHL
jgi:hypothetical protein